MSYPTGFASHAKGDLDEQKAMMNRIKEPGRAPSQYLDVATCRMNPYWGGPLLCCQKDGCGGSAVQPGMCAKNMEFFDGKKCALPRGDTRRVNVTCPLGTWLYTGTPSSDTRPNFYGGNPDQRGRWSTSTPCCNADRCTSLSQIKNV